MKPDRLYNINAIDISANAAFYPLTLKQPYMQICSSLNVRQSPPFSTHFSIKRFESLQACDTDYSAPFLNRHLHSIIWIQNGSGDVYMDLEHFFIEAPVVLYLRPGQVLHLNLSGHASGTLITFEDKFLDLHDRSSLNIPWRVLYNHCQVVPPIKIGHDLDLSLGGLAQKMQEEYLSRQSLHAEVLASLLKVFIICLDRQFQTMEKPVIRSARLSPAALFFSQIENNFKTKKKVKEYADLLNVSTSYLNRIVKDITGFCPRHHIQQRVILEAKRKLIFEGHSLKEIAYTLGFCDPAHFSKYFKTITGSTFKSFKGGIHFNA